MSRLRFHQKRLRQARQSVRGCCQALWALGPASQVVISGINIVKFLDMEEGFCAGTTMPCGLQSPTVSSCLHRVRHGRAPLSDGGPPRPLEGRGRLHAPVGAHALRSPDEAHQPHGALEHRRGHQRRKRSEPLRFGSGSVGCLRMRPSSLQTTWDDC